MQRILSPAFVTLAVLSSLCAPTWAGQPPVRYHTVFKPGMFTKLGRHDRKALLLVYTRNGSQQTLLHRLTLPPSTTIFAKDPGGKRLYLMLADDRCAARLYMRIESLRLDSAHRLTLLKGIAWWQRNRKRGDWAAVIHDYKDHRAMCHLQGTFRLVRLLISTQGSFASRNLFSAPCLRQWIDLSMDAQERMVRFSRNGDALRFRCGRQPRRIRWRFKDAPGPR